LEENKQVDQVQKTENAMDYRLPILRKRIRGLILFFILALVVSGLSAIPLKFESSLLHRLFGKGSFLESIWPVMARWFSVVHEGILTTSKRYPFLFYGTDWLAFAHVVIAISFLGPLRDPVRNIWVIEYGMIACVLIIPTALIFGSIRGIPAVWRILDCGFGVVGLIPLWLVRKDILALGELQT